MPVPVTDAAIRFWAKVANANANGCRLWMASFRRDGYGQFNDGRTIAAAHRTAWILTHGKIPKGLFVLHSCDIKACCAVDHLRLGTATDNSADAKARHRLAVGEKNGRHRLTESQVREIIARRGEGKHALAAEFGVSPGAIYYAYTGRHWAHLQEQK